MPRTRTDVERDAKVDQILDAAEARLDAGGYEALSVAAIARELGVAQNAIYWYFPSKDHLFVAAMQRMLRGIVARKPRGDTGPVARILWFTDRFAALSSLRSSMNDRARRSPVVAEFVEQLESHLSRMLAGVLRGRVPDGDLDVAVETFRATAEGTFAKGLGDAERRRVLTFALERLMED
ncbi:MAG: TetR/AcrR family transcriptional regulator, repressor of the mexAB-oprM multidrug resistance operon [Solirubrobacteraceae bacterium]|jgi:AcrR family transcriptional regulator|nr:TetR/AcrR family transcriptional regulator, repressor of the mexAB-oprM multidrug resistance operon [Solirubrobacteraceae bacterium]